MPIIKVPEDIANMMQEIVGHDDPTCRYRISTRIRKINSDKGDIHVDGDLGTVKGSLRWEIDGTPYCDIYFLHWDNDSEDVIVFMAEQDEKRRLELAM